MTPASASQCVVSAAPAKGEVTPGSDRNGDDEAVAAAAAAVAEGASATSTYISAALFQNAPTVLEASAPSNDSGVPFSSLQHCVP